MPHVDQYPLITPLVERLRSNGAELTDKALQALNLAAIDVKSQNYKRLYDDSLFTGVIGVRGAITGLFEALGIRTEEVIEHAHAALPYHFEYRDRFGRPRDRKKIRDVEEHLFVKQVLHPLDTVANQSEKTSSMVCLVPLRRRTWRCMHFKCLRSGVQ